MDIQLIEQTPSELGELEQKENLFLDGADPDELSVIATKQVLEIDSDDYDKEIKTLIRWAKEKTQSNDYDKIRWAIRDLRLKIGTPSYGDPIKNLSRFAYLELEGKRIEEEKKSFR